MPSISLRRSVCAKQNGAPWDAFSAARVAVGPARAAKAIVTPWRKSLLNSQSKAFTPASVSSSSVYRATLRLAVTYQ